MHFPPQVALLSHLTIQGLAYLVVYNMLKTTDLQIVLQQLPAAVSSRVSTNSVAALLRGCYLPACAGQSAGGSHPREREGGGGTLHTADIVCACP